MVTLSQVSQYASTHGIGEGTDIFNVLSQMQLEYSKPKAPTASKVEYTTQDVLDLFST